MQTDRVGRWVVVSLLLGFMLGTPALADEETVFGEPVEVGFMLASAATGTVNFLSAVGRSSNLYVAGAGVAIGGVTLGLAQSAEDDVSDMLVATGVFAVVMGLVAISEWYAGPTLDMTWIHSGDGGVWAPTLVIDF